MLQSIRDKTHGWIAGVIISLLILSFALWGIHSYLEGASDNSTVAKVNGVEITKGQLAVAYERLRRQLQIQYSSNYALPMQAESTLKNRALQTLVTIQVLKQASIQQGYRVSTAQIDGLLESMPEFQVNNRFSIERFQQVLSTTLFTPGDFLDLLQTSLLIDQPRLGLLFSSTALPNEVGTAVTLVNQERKLSYGLLPFQFFLNQPITIPSDEITLYYNSHQTEFKTPEQVSVDYLELSIPNLMATLNPSEEELKDFYNENANAFALPGQWQLNAILVPVSVNATPQAVTQALNQAQTIQAKITQGAEFSNFAQQYPATALKLQGWVSLDQVPQELQKSVVALTKPGQMIQGPVRTKEGYVLLKLMQIRDAKVQPYTQVRAKVKEALTRQQAQEKFGDLKEKLANLTYEHPESLAQAASTMNLPLRSTQVFTKDKGAQDISAQNKVREAAFSNDVLVSQNNSEVIQLTPDQAVVIRVKTHVPATLLPLDTVKKQIENKLKTTAAENLAAQKAKEITDKLQQGANPETLAQQYHLTWNAIGYIGRHSTRVDAVILDQAFAMPRPTANQKIYSFVKTPTAYAIIAVEDVHDGKLTNQQETDLFAEQIQNTQGVLEYELYKQSMMNQAKINMPSQQDTGNFTN